jgi:hypothetical protein
VNSAGGNAGGGNTPSGSAIVREAVGAGMARALAVVVPAAVAQVIIGAPALRSLLFLVVLVGFGVGGHRAATLAPAAPLTNAALAAVAAFALAQVAGIVVGVLTGGGGFTPVRVAFLGLLATSCGMIGAMVSLRRRSRGGTP